MCFLIKKFQGNVTSCFKYVVENFLLRKNTKTEEKSQTQNTFIFIFLKNLSETNSLEKKQL